MNISYRYKFDRSVTVSNMVRHMAAKFKFVWLLQE